MSTEKKTEWKSAGEVLDDTSAALKAQGGKVKDSFDTNIGTPLKAQGDKAKASFDSTFKRPV